MNRIPKARYTKEVREETVNLARVVGASEASRRRSIPLKTLANWIRAADAGQLSEVSKHQPAASEAELEYRALVAQFAHASINESARKLLR